jgi:hypothetical protein
MNQRYIRNRRRAILWDPVVRKNKSVEARINKRKTAAAVKK